MKNPVYDKDLTPLLRTCSNDDLQQVVDVILADNRQTLEQQAAYREHKGDHKAYLDEIVYEITLFGGNSISNLVRGRGVPYSEMVREVVGLLAIGASVGTDVARMEQLVILKLLELGSDQMDDDDRTALSELLELSQSVSTVGRDSELDAEELTRRLATMGTSLAGDRIRSAVDTARRSVQRRAAATSLMRATLVKVGTVGLGGPISWTATAAQSIYELFGPNRATAVSLVATIGLLRQKHQQLARDNELPVSNY